MADALSRTAAQFRDVETLKDVTAKLSRLLDITVRTKVVTDAAKVTQLWQDFDSVTDDLGVIQQLTLSAWGFNGFATTPPAIREQARTVCGRVGAILTIKSALHGDWREYGALRLQNILNDNLCRDACSVILALDGAIEAAGQGGQRKRGSTPAKLKAKKDAPKSFFIEQAMRSYHKFDGGFVDRTIPPTSGRKLSAFAKKSFSARSVDRWIEDRFGSKEAYASACLDGSLGPSLAVDADSIRAFGTSDQLEQEVTDGDDDERDAPTTKMQRGKRKPKVRQRF